MTKIWSYISYLSYYHTKVNQKFHNILVTWGIIQQFQLLLLMLWTWQTTLDYEMPNLPDNLQELLSRFAPIAWKTALEFTLLGTLDFSQFLRSLQSKQNFSNRLTALWWTVPSLFPHSGCFYSPVQTQSINSQNYTILHISGWLSNSTQKWSNAQRVSTTITIILPNTIWTSLVTSYVLQTSKYQNIANILIHPSIYKENCILKI